MHDSCGSLLSQSIRAEVLFMINFDEEIQKFVPSPEVDEAEDVINGKELTDVTDIIQAVIQQMNQ